MERQSVSALASFTQKKSTTLYT